MSKSQTQHHPVATPHTMARFLEQNPDEAKVADAAASQAKVCLGTTNGWFELTWKASPIGKYDWIGLYKNDNDPDTDYVGGNNWQWAVNGNSYTTATGTNDGYQARYLVWDAASNAYVSIARTPAYSPTVCS